MRRALLSRNIHFCIYLKINKLKPQLLFALFFINCHCPIIFSQNNLPEESIFKIDSLLNSTYSKDKPGGIIAIIKNGETLYQKGIGLANIEFNIPISDSTSFNIGSLSKQFTAFVALTLEEKGKFNLDDDLVKYLPELNKLPYKITLDQLLNHTHGLPNSHELAQLCGKERMSHEEMVDMLLKINSTNFAPGTHFQYNNTGYTLMAEIISRIEDKPFQIVMNDEVFTPLEMKRSTIVNTPSHLVKNKAGSYLDQGDHFAYLFNDQSSMGPGGIYSTIGELSSWATNFLSPKVGKQTMIDKMKKHTKLKSGEIINYGYGIQTKKYKGLDVHFHGGADASYRSYLMHIPDHNLSVIALSNSGDFSALDISHSVIDIIFRFESERDVQTEQYKNEGLYDGTYEMFPGKYFNIISRNDSLYLQQYGFANEILLTQIDKSKYQIPHLPYYNLEFSEGKFDFYIVDSKFTCTKVDLKFPTLEAAELSKFAGIYLNESHQILYRIMLKNDKLIANSIYGLDINLFPLDHLNFYSSHQYFGKIKFNLDSDGQCNGFNLSGSLLNDIVFNKI